MLSICTKNHSKYKLLQKKSNVRKIHNYWRSLQAIYILSNHLELHLHSRFTQSVNHKNLYTFRVLFP